MKYLLLLLSFLFISVAGFSQLKVRGTVKNDDGKNLAGASLVLYYPGTKDSLKTVTNEKGSFTFNDVKKARVEVITSYVGFKKFLSYYDYTEQTGEQNIWDIVLTPGDVTLETVTVEAAKIQIKEDTVSYRIDSTMYRKNDNVEEVLKKLPGIEVDNKTGKVTAQGKEVTKVRVNGKDFFGGDVTTATRELNADMVDKIQVIDDYGDQAAFTGVRDGEASKTLNIQLKKDKNKGYFGNLSAGIGTEDRYQAGVSLNIFNNERQISIIGNMNNTNASTFNFGSAGGAMGGMMAGMASSMGIGRGGAGAGAAFGNFGTSNGLNDTKSIGLNFRDQWGPKVSAYGSYSFSNRQSTTIQNESRQNNITNPNINLTNTNDYAVNNNHRFSFNVEYKIDSFNYLKFSPNVSVTNTNGENFSDFSFATLNGDKNREGIINSFTDSKSPSINGSLLFNHRFKKRGRTLSLNLSGNSGYTESMNDYDNYTDYYFPVYRSDTILQYVTQDNDNRSVSARASYIEPLSKTKSLEFNYSYTRQITGNDRESYKVDPATNEKTYQDSLSNIFDNVYVTNRIGANFRNNQKKVNYSVGFAVQPASIESNSFTGKYSYKRAIFNYFPVFRYQYNFSKSRSFSVNYSGSTRQPSYSQLQPVYDSTNLQYVTLGNPDLKPEFSNSLSLRYNNFDFITGNVFFGTINASFTNDKIVNNAFDRGIAQEIRYLNADGYYSLSAFYNFSRPIQNRKYVFNFGGNASFNNNIAYLENQRTTGKNFVLGQRFSMDYKLKKWLESNLALNFVFNDAQNAANKSASSTTRAWTISHNSRLFLPKGIVFTYDMDKTINSGYGEGVNTNPFIINAALEKQFFKSKKLSLKLNAFDMLNENTSITRTVNSYYITDTRTNRLGRYFMLSAIFRLNKFSGKAPQQNRMMMGGPGGGPGGMHIIRN
ncbi:MAG: outer membrane beta-barrel protein [Rhizobacter sp.]|nr:outer membrane beta-barrel protein [Ferruginibacter sp.]